MSTKYSKAQFLITPANEKPIMAVKDFKYGDLAGWHMRNEVVAGLPKNFGPVNTVCFGPDPEIRLLMWDAPHKEVQNMIDKLNGKKRRSNHA